MTLRGLLADPAVVGAWTLDPARSSVRFTNRTLWGLLKVHGGFDDVDGTGDIGADGTVSGRLRILTASVKTGIGRRDEHLRSPDFFDADTFPEIGIDVAGIAPAGDNSAEVAATVHIRGASHDLPLRATVTMPANDTLHLVGRATVDRTRWGVSGNMFGMMPPSTDLVADLMFVKV